MTGEESAHSLLIQGVEELPLAATTHQLERLLTPPKRGNERMRQIYAAHGLAKLGDAASLPALIEALSDKSDDVRRAAALAIGAIAPTADQSSVNALDRTLTALLKKAR